MMESHRETEPYKSPSDKATDLKKAIVKAEERKEFRKLISRYYVK